MFANNEDKMKCQLKKAKTILENIKTSNYNNWNWSTHRGSSCGEYKKKAYKRV
jgi:hypothetical protein